MYSVAGQSLWRAIEVAWALPYARKKPPPASQVREGDEKPDLTKQTLAPQPGAVLSTCQEHVQQLIHGHALPRLLRSL